VNLLISHNHKPLNYGLSYFFEAIRAIYEEKKEDLKNLALAIRIAKYSSDEDFKEFIEERDEEELDNLNF